MIEKSLNAPRGRDVNSPRENAGRTPWKRTRGEGGTRGEERGAREREIPPVRSPAAQGIGGGDFLRGALCPADRGKGVGIGKMVDAKKEEPDG
jgi:hypothetical protein